MDTLNQGKGHKLIVLSPNRWGGYHNAIMHFLEVRIDFESFLHMDERLEKDDIDRLGWRSITTSDLDVLQAMAYVLYAIKVHSLAAEDAKWPSGVCYFRTVENMVMLLKAMRQHHTQWDDDDKLRIKYMEEQITPVRRY